MILPLETAKIPFLISWDCRVWQGRQVGLKVFSISGEWTVTSGAIPWDQLESLDVSVHMNKQTNKESYRNDSVTAPGTTASWEASQKGAVSQGDVTLLDLGLSPHLEQYQLVSQQIWSTGRRELSQKYVLWHYRDYCRLRPLWPTSVFSFIGNKAVPSSPCKKKNPIPYLQMVLSFKTRTSVFSTVHPLSPPCLKLLNPVSKCTLGRVRGESLPPWKKPDLKNSQGDNWALSNTTAVILYCLLQILSPHCSNCHGDRAGNTCCN